MIRRRTAGPESAFERSGAEVYRPVQHPVAWLKDIMKSQASGLVLGAAAWAMWAEPASVDLVGLASLSYAAWVLTRRVVLPLRLPKSARRRDYNHPDPTGRPHWLTGQISYRPRMAAGIIYLGREQDTGKELWIGNEDARQHVSVPGTTGAGKTVALLSLVANALTHASGFIFVDGKADNSLYARAYALARRFGREDDVLTLNLLAQGKEHTNTRNPFRTGSADMIRELLATLIGETGPNDQNEVFKGRAIGLLGALIPVLVWMRDNKGVLLTVDRIRFAMELRNIILTAVDRQFPVLDLDTGEISNIPIPDVPEAMLYPLRAYLGETGGYDVRQPFERQKMDEPSRQHSFVIMYFSRAFTQLGVTLGHIFNVEIGDIDMRDVVLNRRILIVNLPALENSDSTNAALGKLIIADLRNMMAQTLGASLEGDAAEIVENKPTMAPTPFPVVFDEIAYYVSEGMDRMLAMGRGLGFMFYLAFQEVAGLRARIGDKMYSLLGNANLQILMKLQEGGETRRYVEQTAGDSFVTQASGFHSSDLGSYHETRQADIRRTARVDWIDLRRQIEGEAVILFGDRRVYAKLFHVDLEPSGSIRLNRPVMLLPPDPGPVRDQANRVDRIREALHLGLLAQDHEPEQLSPRTAALLQTFQRRLAAGDSSEGAADAAIAEAGKIATPEPLALPAPAEHGAEMPDAPETEFTAMLEATSAEAKPSRTDAPISSSVGYSLLRDLVAIEQTAGLDTAEARIATLRALAGLDLSHDDAPAPAPMTETEFRATLETIITGLVACAIL